ncbi:MAG TPA: helix-turn-helix domain-containing protein [Opitutaceae bacterium]
MRQFSAIYVSGGTLRKVLFEAATAAEAQELATKWGFGIQGEISETTPPPADKTTSLPEAFDVENACRMLGDISRTTLYRLLVRGKLERVPATRKVLVTRRSIERFCSMAA